MHILMINTVCGIRSTGRICTDIAESLSAKGHEVKIAYGRETIPEKYAKYAIRIGHGIDVYINALKVRLFDNEGLNAVTSTNSFLNWADKFNPDILWLHNLHGYYINYSLLFQWIKSRPQMKVWWTLHDCWAFTGHCSHFTIAKCEQWKTQCTNCIQKKAYPASFLLDNCKENFREKKSAFCGVQDMTIITPSEWLANLVKESFLKEYPVVVRNNTIDTTVFKPTQSDFKQRLGIQEKKIVLGVASVWGKDKGLYDFIKLAELLDDNYVIVLVGLTGKEHVSFPHKIIGIKRTNSVNELAEIYTAADVFVNLTYQDNYPTVNLEAIACGTPVITYDTGGSPESASEFGVVVPQGDICTVVERIKKANEIKRSSPL